MSTLVINGDALSRARGLPLTFQNALASHECVTVENRPSELVVKIPPALRQLQTGEEFIRYLGLI